MAAITLEKLWRSSDKQLTRFLAGKAKIPIGKSLNYKRASIAIIYYNANSFDEEDTKLVTLDNFFKVMSSKVSFEEGVSILHNTARQIEFIKKLIGMVGVFTGGTSTSFLLSANDDLYTEMEEFGWYNVNTSIMTMSGELVRKSLANIINSIATVTAEVKRRPLPGDDDVDAEWESRLKDVFYENLKGHVANIATSFDKAMRSKDRTSISVSKAVIDTLFDAIISNYFIIKSTADEFKLVPKTYFKETDIIDDILKIDISSLALKGKAIYLFTVMDLLNTLPVQNLALEETLNTMIKNFRITTLFKREQSSEELLVVTGKQHGDTEKAITALITDYAQPLMWTTFKSRLRKL